MSLPLTVAMVSLLLKKLSDYNKVWWTFSRTRSIPTLLEVMSLLLVSALKIVCILRSKTGNCSYLVNFIPKITNKDATYILCLMIFQVVIVQEIKQSR